MLRLKEIKINKIGLLLRLKEIKREWFWLLCCDMVLEIVWYRQLEGLVWVGVDCIGLWLKVKEIKEKEKDFDLDIKSIVFNWNYFWKLKLVLNER